MMTCPGRARVGGWPHGRECPLLRTPRSHEAAAARWIRCAARRRDVRPRGGRLHRPELAAGAARPRPRPRLSRRSRALGRGAGRTGGGARSRARRRRRRAASGGPGAGGERRRLRPGARPPGAAPRRRGPAAGGRLAGSFNAMAESLARSRAALEEKVRELERANHLKSEFLATVSHELRTPLNVILGYTEMLAEGAGGAVTPAQAEMIGTIDRYSRNQLELITSVLDFTRLSSGRVSLNVERFPLAPLLNDIQTLQSARLRSPDVGLTVAVDTEVAEIETDRVKLQEIVRNLVDNAVKFTEVGTIAVHTHLAEPGWVAVDVADSGPGIPAEEVEDIFDAFHQLGASSTRGTGGVGLGLSIVRQLAEALGGRVSVTSRLGEGSLFRVLIPCVAGPAAADPGSSATSASALDAAARNATASRRRARSIVRGSRGVRAPKP